ncbi:flagellar protein FlaG [Hippea alviniae]|uniref:flagellar protein FlaG n=1 Tax=Hippea alviniae TaxID=1279027 RepID=UPI0003B732D8|nr:flagellar protein FlaG [Hippea alviniae]
MSAGINKIPDQTANLQSNINKQQQRTTQHVSQQTKIEQINTKIQQNQTTKKAQKLPSPKELKKIIDKINENVNRLNKEVKFVYNDTLKSLIVKVIDEKTGKVIREIPPQEVVNLQKKLSEIVGIIFDSKEVEK